MVHRPRLGRWFLCDPRGPLALGIRAETLIPLSGIGHSRNEDTTLFDGRLNLFAKLQHLAHDDKAHSESRQPRADAEAPSACEELGNSAQTQHSDQRCEAGQPNP
jgi:hypothetical protein